MDSHLRDSKTSKIEKIMVHLFRYKEVNEMREHPKHILERENFSLIIPFCRNKREQQKLECFLVHHNTCIRTALYSQSLWHDMYDIRIFPKLYKVGNIVNKGLHREEQNKFSNKKIQWE